MESVDAVVIGAGHHGLVSAAVLADAGWDVLVLEERDEVGGAVASREVDGWVMDEFSACHPLGVASPVLTGLGLEDHGLSWAHAPRVVAHVGEDDDPGVVMERDPAATAATLEADHPGDGEAWVSMVEHWQTVREPLLAALLTAWPPVTDTARLVRRLGLSDSLDLARLALLPVDRLGRERFGGEAGRSLLAGNALHADISPTGAGSGLYGWMMTMLAQDVGFPSPVGGTRMLAEALRSRAEAGGARVETGVRVEAVPVRGGRATGVVTADGRRVRARRAVVADTSAPALYDRLLPASAVPAGLRRRLERFEWDLPTIKLNFRLSEPAPWRSEAARGAAVVHAGQSSRGLVRWAAAIDSGVLPERPFALVGQMSTVDPTRSPEGTEALWAYSHVPRESWADHEVVAAGIERVEEMLEGLAPGFREVVLDQWDQTPTSLQESDANLGQGGVGGGTQQLFQQAIFRPVTGLGGPRTHLAGLYLGSAAIHPGGGVHGGCGWLAANAALRDHRWWGRPVARAQRGLLGRIHGG